MFDEVGEELAFGELGVAGGVDHHVFGGYVAGGRTFPALKASVTVHRGAPKLFVEPTVRRNGERGLCVGVVDVQILRFRAQGEGQAGHRPADGAVEVQVALLGAPHNAGAQVEDVRTVFKGRLRGKGVRMRVWVDAQPARNAGGPAVFVLGGHREEGVFEEVLGQHNVADEEDAAGKDGGAPVELAAVELTLRRNVFQVGEVDVGEVAAVEGELGGLPPSSIRRTQPQIHSSGASATSGQRSVPVYGVGHEVANGNDKVAEAHEVVFVEEVCGGFLVVGDFVGVDLRNIFASGGVDVFLDGAVIDSGCVFYGRATVGCGALGCAFRGRLFVQ